jgi:hypothetical protein
LYGHFGTSILADKALRACRRIRPMEELSPKETAEWLALSA